jgi:hypothetical protein
MMALDVSSTASLDPFRATVTVYRPKTPRGK